MVYFNDNIMYAFIHTGTVGFNDGKHMTNFIRYLFGAKTGRHVVNENTRFNVASENMKDFYYTEDPFEGYHRFLRSIDKTKYKEYANDVFYVPFVAKDRDGIVVSNFLKKRENGDLEVTLQVDGEYVFETLVTAAGGENKLENIFKKILEGIETVTPYTSITGKARMEHEKFIHTEIERLYPTSPILSISHADQHDTHPDYHIHRLYRRG